MDFMSDALYVGRKFRTLNELDEGHADLHAVELPSVLLVYAGVAEAVHLVRAR